MEQSTTAPPGRSPADWEAALAAHEGLVRWVVRQQRRGALPWAEVLHAGRIGLWQALRRYDPTRGTQFSTYAVPAIQHAVWAAVAAAPAGPRALAGAGEPAGADPAPDPGDVVYQAQVQAAVTALVGQLPPRLRAVVVAHYGLDGTPPQAFAALGRPLGVSRQRVHQLHRAALVVLAHPAHSLPLRRLVDRHQRADYQQALARQRQYARAARRRRGGRA
jgi:RNA polymerase sigma factor (sigma-70 family)